MKLPDSALSSRGGWGYRLDMTPRLNSLDPKNSKYGPALSLGTTFSAGMLLCAGIGYLLDLKVGSGHAFTLVGLFVGLLASAYEVYKVIQVLQREDEETSADE